MKHGSLFSGIGGFDLAAEWMGWDNVFHCEWNDFGQRILKYYWPNAISYNDITKTNFTIHRGSIDILTGGFPCQPYSTAGKRLGKEDERHLWPEMCRAIREIRPTWIVGENVLGLVGWNGGMVFDEVQIDLETEGYEVQPFVLPAAAVNAPHRRDRVWFVAQNTRSERLCDGTIEAWRRRDWQSFSTSCQWLVNQKDCNASNTDGIGRRENERKRNRKSNVIDKNGTATNWETFPTVSPLCDGNDGLPDRLDGITFSKWRNESIKGGGNAVVPQVVLQIFKAIEEYETKHTS